MSTPTEPNGPTFTASGRQVKARHGGAYGESVLNGQHDAGQQPSSNGVEGTLGDDEQPPTRSRLRGAGRPRIDKPRGGKYIDGYNSLDEMDDESSAQSSGNEWDGGDDDDGEDEGADDEEEEEDDDDVKMVNDDVSVEEDKSEGERDERARSLLVSFRYQKLGSSPRPQLDMNGVSSNDLPIVKPDRTADVGSASKGIILQQVVISPKPDRSQAEEQHRPGTKSGPSQHTPFDVQGSSEPQLEPSLPSREAGQTDFASQTRDPESTG